MKNYNVSVIGCGNRGEALAVDVLCSLNYVKIVSLCDPYKDKAEKVAEKIKEKTSINPKIYTDYEKALVESKPDAVLVATSWEDHIKVSIFALKLGIPVAMEVGGAYSLDECFELVKAYEETKTPFMFMENCCFNKDELLATSLVRNGLFGDIVYCHGAYSHDLREEVAFGDIKRHYRLRNYVNRNCENYPTHDLGPIAKLLDINRGNRMLNLISVSSKAKGLHEYVLQQKEVENLKDVDFKQGDIVETIINCENGEMITLKLDTTLPRYYSREFTVRGTKGMYEQNANLVVIDGKTEELYDPTAFYKKYMDNAKEFEKDYLVDAWKNVTPEIIKSGHGGMDYFEFVAFFDALENKKEMPIDVYDAASWMCISCLSEESIKNGGKPVEIPDFTSGKYKKRKRKDVLSLPAIKK